jgi:hypothetical protein
MTQDFDSWLAMVVADEEDPTGVVDPNWRLWLQGVFQEWGSLSRADVEQLGRAEEGRLQAVQLEAARRAVPAIIADGHAVGRTLGVELSWSTENGGHLEVEASSGPGNGYYQTSSSDAMELFLSDAERLVWLAGEVQEALMERPQVDRLVWPMCPEHCLGCRAVVVEGTAIWRCNGGGGHVLARIGELDGVAKPAH